MKLHVGGTSMGFNIINISQSYILGGDHLIPTNAGTKNNKMLDKIQCNMIQSGSMPGNKTAEITLL